MKKQYNFATWLRSFSVILILLCHFVQENTNPLIQMTGQFFNIGVQIFIILSGFLFGISSSWILDCIIVFIVTIMMSVIVKNVSDGILKSINKFC